jgi:diacylglycerol kinase family enzyme
MTRPIIVLLNAHARGGQAHRMEATITAAFEQAGAPVIIRRARRKLPQAVQEALHEGYTTIVAAGGDGTIRTVAAAVARRGATLGVIPIGTFNHFAKALSIPRTIPEAVAVIVAGHRREVDYGTVNGRFFINSAAMGIHPLFVRRRLAYERHIGKWLAIPVALIQAFRRFGTWRVTLELPDGHHQLVTPFIFIGNNDYQVEQLGLPSRRFIDDGQLFIYSLECHTRRHLLWLFMRSLLGGLHSEKYFHSFSAKHCRIVAKGPVHITLDGELVQLKTPLDFKSHPGGLTVLAPPA